MKYLIVLLLVSGSVSAAQGGNGNGNGIGNVNVQTQEEILSDIRTLLEDIKANTAAPAVPPDDLANIKFFIQAGALTLGMLFGMYSWQRAMAAAFEKHF